MSFEVNKDNIALQDEYESCRTKVYSMSDQNAFSVAKERYQELGIDAGRALDHLAPLPLTIHCRQADDVGGFDTPGAELSGEGIQVTDSYPGKARTLEEIRADSETA